MPKGFPPSLLEDPKTREFCSQQQITDSTSLRHHLLNSVCFGIDAEGREGTRGGVTAIGLAVLPPSDLSSIRFPSPPFETQDLIERYYINAYCIYLEGRSRQKPFPPFPFGSNINTSNPEEEIQSVVKSIKQHYTSNGVILASWHPHPGEFPAIQALFPSVFREVVRWVDLVDVMQQLCVSKQEDFTKLWPPLSDLLLCIGFGESCLPERYCYNAGSDAVHTVIALARLLTYELAELPIEVRRRRPLKQWQRANGPDTAPASPKIAGEKIAEPGKLSARVTTNS